MACSYVPQSARFNHLVYSLIRLSRAAIAAVLIALFLQSCDRPDRNAVEIYGQTMGTRYSVLLPDIASQQVIVALKAAIDSRLDEIVSLASTYDVQSELSRFNRAGAGDWVDVSPELVDIVLAARGLHEATGGAFDPSVGPLVNLWGFGPEEDNRLPSEAERRRVQAGTGIAKLSVRRAPDPALKKSIPDFYLDLSAVAKGYAVDEIAELLNGQGVENYLVEIGGEVRGRGLSADGNPWRIAIERPGSAETATDMIISLDVGAVATSGSYRNVYTRNGKTYSHIIDPRTGAPVEHSLVSVTVLAKSAMEADGLATALMVMGADAGTRWAASSGVSACFIVAGKDGYSIAATGALSHLQLTGI